MTEDDQEPADELARTARGDGETVDASDQLPARLLGMGLQGAEAEDDEEKLASRLAGMGIEAGGWEHELKRQAHEGVPVEHLLPAAQRMRETVQEEAARLSGKKLYDVNLRFSRILARDKDEAIDEAEVGYGHLVERRAWVVFDPNTEDEAAGTSGGPEPPSELQIPPAPEPPSLDRAEFLVSLDEVCVDPLSGETVLPDYVMISQDLYDGLVTDPARRSLPPDTELTGFEFPVRVVPHEDLKRISGTDAHLLAFDRRRTLEEPVEAWAGTTERWEAAVKGAVGA